MRYYSVFSYRGQPSVSFDDNDRYSSWFTVHNPYVDENIFVYDMELKLQDSVSGTFTFKVPLTHPNINAFNCGLILEIREFDGEPKSIEDANIGGNPIWIGRLINLSSDIYGNLDCTCEGPLGFLKDGFISATNAPHMHPNTTLLDYIKSIIDLYLNSYQGENSGTYRHARQPGTKILKVETSIAKTAQTTYVDHYISQLDGFETVNGLSYYAGSDPINVFDFIKKYFEDGLSSIAGIQYASEYAWINMDIVPRNSKNTDIRLPKTEGLTLWLGIDDVSQGFASSRQRIIFGENLINAELEYDFNNIATSLMVLGAEYEDEDGNTVRYNLKGATDLDTMTDIVGYYIDSNNGAIEKYGIIPKTVVNDHLDSRGNVALWANMHRNALSNPVVSFKCRAIDMSIFDPNQDDFTLGEYAEVRFPGLDERDTTFYYRCTGIKQNLSDPSKDEFTFSYSRETTLTSNSIFKNKSTTAGSTSAAGSDGSGSGGSKYELPIASSEILGGIKVGHNLAIKDDGTLRMTYVDEGRAEGSYAGYKSTAEGSDNISSGSYCHVEGASNSATSTGMHIEGYGNTSSGSYNHTEGYKNTVTYGPYCHVEGRNNTVYGEDDHIEGYINNVRLTGASNISQTVSGTHVEGYNNMVPYKNENTDKRYSVYCVRGSHIEGHQNIVNFNWSCGTHVEGYGNNVDDITCYIRGAHIEGYDNIIKDPNRTEDTLGGDSPISSFYWNGAHIEGNGNTVYEEEFGYTFASAIHVEGSRNVIRGVDSSHIEGYNNEVNYPRYAHVGGSNNRVKNVYESNVNGSKNKIERFWTGAVFGSNNYTVLDVKSRYVSNSIICGEGLATKFSEMACFGSYNTFSNFPGVSDEWESDNSSGSTGDVSERMIIGNGYSESKRSNAFRIDHNGNVYAASSVNSSGADYAELFEWTDSNPNSEDRVGRFVILDGEYISLANSETSTDDILGIISGNPSIAGDVYDDQWSGMYETDIYGRPLYEEVHHEAELDEEGNVIREAYDSMERKVNPNYDSTKRYKPRSQRSEWDYVGLMGKLVMLDDGTAEVNGYVKPSNDGIATKSENRTKFRVMRRLDENHIKILVL